MELSRVSESFFNCSCHTARIFGETRTDRDSGRAHLSIEAVPRLPLAWRYRRQTRSCSLDAVAVRLTEDQLVRQVLQGGGNMPAYGKNLNPAETTALVAFLETLHPGGQAPARDPSLASGVQP
jgi:hypothetical protein